jgi:hypothetical protein
VTDLVEVGRFNSRVEADLARLYLQSEGVEAVLFDTEVSNFYGFFASPFMPIRLMVLDEDIDEARRLLRDYDP